MTASVDGTARIWDADSGAPLGDPARVTATSSASAAFSPDGERVVTASVERRRGSGTPRAARRSRRCVAIEDDVDSAAFSPDGERVVTAS